MVNGLTKWGDTPLSDFQFHKMALAEGGYNYYLFIHAKGQAIVMRQTADETEILYAKAGMSDSGWVDRATLSYVTYDKLDS